MNLLVGLESTKLRFRPLRAGDFGQLKKIERVSLDEYRRYLRRTGEIDTVTPLLTAQYFHHYLKTSSCFVAEIGQRIIGYILSQPTSYVHARKKELWLEYVVVLSGYRGKGIGYRLLTEVMKWAGKNRFTMLYTSLNPNNPESRSLLAKHGFEVRNWLVADKALN